MLTLVAFGVQGAQDVGGGGAWTGASWKCATDHFCQGGGKGSGGVEWSEGRQVSNLPVSLHQEVVTTMYKATYMMPCTLHLHMHAHCVRSIVVSYNKPVS